MKFLLLSVLTCGLITQVFTKRMQDNEIDYLVRYGYMQPTVEGEEHTDDDMREGLMRFQKFNGMEETGDMSEEMHTMMEKPRCGMKDMDIDTPSYNITRFKRYMITGQRWGNPKLTYKYLRNPEDLRLSDAKQALADAFKVWSDVTPLQFTEVSGNTEADINILFQAGQHGDGVEGAFDGPNGVLAHAYFPGPGIGGDAHFDEAETFTINGNGGIDLFQVAAHEFGHSMGLGHSEDPNALMAPYYPGYIPNFKLPQDDINGIQALYGSNENPVEPQQPGTGGSTPDICRSDIDAVVVYRPTETNNNGRIMYIFQDSEVTRLEMTGIPVSGYPQPISSVFNGLVSNIDAAYYSTHRGRYRFFKDNMYWEFDSSRNLLSGFPKNIRELSTSLPNKINAAVTWSSDWTAFFTDTSYVFFYEPYNVIYYSGSIRDGWGGVPDNLHAGFRWGDGGLYFIKDGEYYKWQGRVDTSSYPRTFGEDWLSCQKGSYNYNPNSGHSHVYSLSALMFTLLAALYL